MGNGSVLHGRVLHTARIDFDERENLLVARLLGMRDIAGFHTHELRSQKCRQFLRPCRSAAETLHKINHLANWRKLCLVWGGECAKVALLSTDRDSSQEIKMSREKPAIVLSNLQALVPSRLGGIAPKSVKMVAALALAVGLTGAQGGILDLKVVPSSGSLNGGIFETPTNVVSGTGLIDPFVRIQMNGTESGYNTSAPLNGQNQDLDMKDGPWTHDLKVGDIQTNKVIIGGKSYYQFVLDIDEANGGTDPNGNIENLLTINTIKFFLSPTGVKNVDADSNIANIGNLGTLVWDMDANGDNRIDLDYNNFSGNGRLDMFAYIPTEVFGTNLNAFIYMYSAYGNPYGSSAGFEEWAHKKSGFFPCTVDCSPPPNEEVPEPGSLALVGLALLGAASARRCRKQNK